MPGVKAAERVATEVPEIGGIASRIYSGTPGSVGGGIARLKPTLTRAAVVGGIAGAAQEPEGNTGYSGRIAPAVSGVLGGAILGKLGTRLKQGQHEDVSRIVSGLAGLMGAEAGASLGGFAAGGIGGLGAYIISMYALHNAGFGVNAVKDLAPLIAERAAQLAQTSVVGPVGVGVGKTVNEIGERT
jgi:hypothetical protein